MNRKFLVPLIISGLFLLHLPSAQAATVICIKNSNGLVTLRSKKCKTGESIVRNRSQLMSTTVIQGAAGPAGADGTPGSLRVFGDGSMGDVVQTTDLDEPNLQYHDFTVPEGKAIAIQSGTVIRCTGKFFNTGTITVLGSDPTIGQPMKTPNNVPAWASPHVGGALTSASNGEVGTGAVFGGVFGKGLYEGSAKAFLKPGPAEGGGAGGLGGRVDLYPSSGGGGGGVFVVLAQEGITNQGIIRANGSDGYNGGGGGAGGIVILASNGAISAGGGTIEARGGNGGNSLSTSPAGGGGGGGIIHLLSRDIVGGAIDVAGGSAGNIVGAITHTLRTGGGGGGALGGNGGVGGQVFSDDSFSAASPGSSGYIFQTTDQNLDVSGLF